ncbi:MAG: site-2 protease family protein [Thioclava sp.]|nr:site-2 protease family protein [Thioclava sp.]MBD3803639.1 site-2 protease family protein [Thioclava sp.]
MSWSFPIGKVRGTELRVHVTFFLLLAWIMVGAWMAEGPQSALVNMLFIVSVFACVMLHELGHATMAARFGVKTPDITLLPIGGLARLERIPENPKQEILIAVAGPAVNIVIWIVLSVLIGVRGQIADLQSLESLTQDFWARLAVVNLLLVAFNMIPAFPMDGGRVFRAVLALFMDRVKATQIAAQVGRVLALALGLWGVMQSSPILVLIAVFIYFAGGAESADVTMRGRARGAQARDAMITAFASLSPEDSLEDAARLILRTTQSEFPVLGPDGAFLGFLTRAEVMSFPEPEHRAERVSDHMLTGLPALPSTAPLQAVLEAMSGRHVPAVAVTGDHGRFIGYVNRENIGEWFILARR